MKQTIDNRGFHQAFANRGRGDQYSADALDALFGYFEEFESLTGEDLELDVIAICCDWAEYDSAIEAANELTDWEPDEDEDEDANETHALEYLCDRANVLGTHSGSVLVQNF